jgi:large subunit ribosomal protein L21
MRKHMFAIVTINGKQYTVSVGDNIEVDSIPGNAGDILTFDHVLLVSDDKKTKIGTPVVAGLKIKAKILSQKQSEKVEVRRFKSKVRYRKHIGFRAQKTQLEITAIG